MSDRTLCIFNPEHDLCLANGDRHYLPPASALEFASRDAGLMQELYPGATCTSVYDLDSYEEKVFPFDAVRAWGWNAVVRHELCKRGVPESILPTSDTVDAIRRLQHRSSFLALQSDCRAVESVSELDSILLKGSGYVLKAPWSGAGRGLRWITGKLTELDIAWMNKTIKSQRCIIVEPLRDVVGNVALEYRIEAKENGQDYGVDFIGYSYFITERGVYRNNVMWTDEEIEAHFSMTELQETKSCVEKWLENNVVGEYVGPLGVDLLICRDNSVHVSELNFRHTMGMVAHSRILRSKSKSVTTK